MCSLCDGLNWNLKWIIYQILGAFLYISLLKKENKLIPVLLSSTLRQISYPSFSRLYEVPMLLCGIVCENETNCVKSCHFYGVDLLFRCHARLKYVLFTTRVYLTAWQKRYHIINFRFCILCYVCIFLKTTNLHFQEKGWRCIITKLLRLPLKIYICTRRDFLSVLRLFVECSSCASKYLYINVCCKAYTESKLRNQNFLLTLRSVYS